MKASKYLKLTVGQHQYKEGVTDILKPSLKNVHLGRSVRCINEMGDER